MSLPGFSVKNPILVNLVMWGIIILGVASWFSLVREFFPAMDSDKINISVTWPGATPEEVEKAVARPVERAVDALEGVKEVSTRVFEGRSVTSVEFDRGVDMDEAINDVRSAIDIVKPDMPESAEDPTVSESLFTMPVIGVAVHGDVDERTLRTVAKQIRDEVLDLEGVSRVFIMGVRGREWRIEVAPEALEAAGLTFGEVGRAISAGNRDLPGGQLKSARGNIPVRTLGERSQARDLEDLVVRARPDGRTTRLGAIGEIHDTFNEDTNHGSFDGERAVMLTISKTNEEDALVIANAVRAYVADNPTRLGGAIHLTKTTDLARMIEGRLDLMIRNSRTGLILVLITLAVFLEFRVAFWVAMGLPIAFLATFIAMPYVGVSINMISLFGLIVVLGMIVDDGIVIGENIFTKLRQGLPPAQAAREGAEEVTWPVLAAIATTCCAFAPMLFLSGRMGTFMEVIPMVVIVALLVSLIEAFMILPAHLSHDYFGWIGKFLPRGAKVLGARVTARRRDLIEGWMPDSYERWLRLGLRWRYPALAIAFSALLGSFGLIASGMIQFRLFDRADAETLSVDVEMAPGTSAEVTAAVMKRFEERARSLPEVQAVFGSLGASFSEGGVSAGSDPSTVGQLSVELLPSEERERQGLRKSLEVEIDLRKAAIGVSGIRKMKVAGRSGGPGATEMAIRVRGSNLERVTAAVAYIKTQVADFDGVEEIRDDLQPGKQEVRLRLNPAGEALGLTTQGIAVAMRGALFGVEAQDLQAEDEEVKVRVQLPRADRSALADLGRVRIATPAGGRVPLEEVVDLSLARGYAWLRRVDGQRSVTVEVGVDPDRGNLSEITSATAKRLADIGERFPGITIAFVGARKDTSESLGALVVGFPLALLGIYGIIAMVFRSYIQPFIVMSVIPFAVFGAIVGHLLMGVSFQLLSMIGVVALAGIVVNDSLILVDFVNRRLQEGAPVMEAVVSGGRARMRAILLTTITTISGLAPMMLEESFQARFLIPMAISLCFGLAFATVLTLGLVPILYLVLEDIRGLVHRILVGHWPEPIQAGRGAPAAAEPGIVAAVAPAAVASTEPDPEQR